MWIAPEMDSLAHPIQYAQKQFYLNASCVPGQGVLDDGHVAKLYALANELAPGARVMLLAFDYHHDEAGARRLDLSSYHTPDEYAARIAQAHPDRFEWIASIHPYRADCVDALERAARAGARAIKWLPSAMGMDPASPRCDRFYEALARIGLPLLTHAGAELAVHGSAYQDLGNPLRLRRALDHGVRVIVAHCASLGSGVDLDRGPDGASVSNFALFARLMDEPRYEGRLFGEISAMTQINRLGTPLRTLLARPEWHTRLVNGSDYPLPGVMPLFSLARMVDGNYLSTAEAKVLSEVRRYNPLLFDFALKRLLRDGGRRLAPTVFASRRVFGVRAA